MGKRCKPRQWRGRRLYRGWQGNTQGKRDQTGIAYAATGHPAGQGAARMIGLLAGLAGNRLAEDGAFERAEDDAFARSEACGMGTGCKGQDGGLDQKRPDHDQRNAVFIPAKPPHALC